ncbi:DUF1963 domain-containing protein [Kordia algicida OT-1]|uniref:DUF1963 domain-containing protein n=1 Tax=Kordia algicida OT-1 TaxID=391587 RepID=A9EDX4_9FLAO|nr:DUF1963 domain-containing protein [Kordia algicida]EDP94190.1 hypothetical protein KAOT1_02306 [Kordia algicida OT-1]
MYEEIKKSIIDSFPLQFNIVEGIIKHSIGLRISVDSRKKNNQSKFGGFPSIYKNSKPDLNSNNEFKMLCEIHLAEIKLFDKYKLLPSNGILCFFINPNSTRFEFNDYKVIYSETSTDKILISEIKFSNAVFTENSLVFFEHYTFPSYQEKARLEIEDTIDDDVIESIYEEICEITEQTLEIGHQILGEPQATQGTVKYWWALKYLGYDKYDELNVSQQQEISTIQDDFVLILQIDLEDENISFTNFETGVLYFGITKNDLKNKAFEKVVLVYQSS